MTAHCGTNSLTPIHISPKEKYQKHSTSTTAIHQLSKLIIQMNMQSVQSTTDNVKDLLITEFLSFATLTLRMPA
jgi:hypothetical protein